MRQVTHVARISVQYFRRAAKVYWLESMGKAMKVSVTMVRDRIEAYSAAGVETRGRAWTGALAIRYG